MRLSARDLRRWVRITGFEPIGIRCVDDLANYVRACKAHFWGSSDDTKFIHWLIDEEFLRCTGAEAESTSPPPGDTTKAGRPRHRRGSGRLVALDGGPAKLEREWLRLMLLGQDASPRAQQLGQDARERPGRGTAPGACERRRHKRRRGKPRHKSVTGMKEG